MAKPIFLQKNMILIFLVTLMMVMGVASITPSFPKMVKDLKVTPEKITLLITVFTLPGIFLTPVMGFLADRYGRKQILVPSLIFFGVFGSLCAFVTDFHLLLFLRFLQGMGAASLGAMNVTLIGDFFSGKERSMAMGYNASVLSIGTASYPALGGFVANFHWSYTFLLPLAAIPIGLAVLFFQDVSEFQFQKDIKNYFKSVSRFLNDRTVWGLFISSVLVFIILYGVFLSYFPFLMEQKFSSTSLQIGLLMSIMSLFTALVSTQLGRIHNFFSKKGAILAGAFLYMIAAGLMIFVAQIWIIVIITIVFGLAQGITIPSLQTYLVEIAPPEYRAIFMSLNVMVLRTGQTIGPVVFALIFVLGGMDLVFAMGAVAGLILLFVAYLMIKQDRSM